MIEGPLAAVLAAQKGERSSMSATGWLLLGWIEYGEGLRQGVPG